MHSFRYTVRFDYAFTVDKTTAGTDNMNSCVTYYHLLIDQDLNLNASYALSSFTARSASLFRSCRESKQAEQFSLCPVTNKALLKEDNNRQVPGESYRAKNPTLLSYRSDRGKRLTRTEGFGGYFNTRLSLEAVIKDAWIPKITGAPLYIVHKKLAVLKAKLKIWNQNVFGNIHRRDVINGDQDEEDRSRSQPPSTSMVELGNYGIPSQVTLERGAKRSRSTSREHREEKEPGRWKSKERPSHLMEMEGFSPVREGLWSKGKCMNS
ncbi:hypothetical protein Nepgr_012500 [Nepenthes gracilis]|uniref:Uncharacterized protein n=1 Tax=Nepenthes gracilis TaxID=150966 RepID=A0AAD3SHC0_NEPGR|nr:hypothetical protein Nepgr_012500 [Nepenthes gracilis]